MTSFFREDIVDMHIW